MLLGQHKHAGQPASCGLDNLSKQERTRLTLFGFASDTFRSANVGPVYDISVGLHCHVAMLKFKQMAKA